MASLIRQLNSQTSYMADGSTTLWNFSFPYISAAHVKAQYVTAAGLVVNAGYTLIGPAQLSITPAVPNGAKLTIYRDTPKSAPLVDFIDRANLTEASLDLNAKQDIYAAAEAFDWAQVARTDPLPVYTPVPVTGNTSKNVLINGHMNVGQRPSSALNTFSYGQVDRWIVYLATLTGYTSGSSFRYISNNTVDWQYTRLNRLGDCTCTAGRPTWVQRVEGGNALSLAGHLSTFSGRILHDVQADLEFRISVFGTVNTIYDTRLYYQDIIVPYDTRLPFALTGLLDYNSATLGCQVVVELKTAIPLNNNNFYLGDCQWEKGDVATSLEVRSNATELLLCQRYYENFGIGQIDFIGNNFQAGQLNSFPVPMRQVKRTTPTVSGGWTTVNGTVATFTTNPNNVTLNLTNTAAGQWRATNNTLFTIDAEL